MPRWDRFELLYRRLLAEAYYQAHVSAPRVGSSFRRVRACVLVGFDGSPESVMALRAGAREAAKRGALLRVVEAYRWAHKDQQMPREGVRQRARRLRTGLRAAVDDVLAGLPAEEVPEVALMLVPGTPARGSSRCPAMRICWWWGGGDAGRWPASCSAR